MYISGRASAFAQYLGGLALFASTTALAASTADDILVFRHCSRRAIEKAEADKKIQELLGVGIQPGGWQKATIGFTHKGQLVSCSFPVYGSRGSAEIKLKAVRAPGNGVWEKVFKSGVWELIAVEADVHTLEGGLQHPRLNVYCCKGTGHGAHAGHIES